MTEEGGDIEDEQNKRKPRKLLLHTGTSIWKNIDNWIKEEPAVRRAQFETVKSAMLVHCEYITIVMSRVEEEEDDESTNSNTMQEYMNFMNIVGDSSFINGEDHLPSINIYALLSELYSTIPEHSSDTGLITRFLKDHLSFLLAVNVGWTRLLFSPDLVRSVYWQLMFTFHLTPVRSENQADRTMDYDENRSKLMFASLIVAIIVAIWRDNEAIIGPLFPSSEGVLDVAEYLISLISSPHFRSLSQFFLFGIWLMTKYKAEGGCVIESEDRPYTDGMFKEDEQQKRITDPSFTIEFEVNLDDGTPDRVQREWEAYSIALLKGGLLRAPNGFKIVQKGGRPRKYPYNHNRKRKIDEPTTSEDFGESPQSQPSRFQKKEKAQKLSPKKQLRDSRKNSVKEKEQPFQEPSTSTASPHVSTPPRPPRKVIPSADEVGLCKPIFVMQADLLKKFKEEVQRRKAEGCSIHDRERVEKLMVNAYDEMHRVARLTVGAKPRVLTKEQKQVMEQFRKIRNRGSGCMDGENEEIDDEEEEEEEEEHVPEVVAAKVAKSSVKSSSKKWKRRY